MSEEERAPSAVEAGEAGQQKPPAKPLQPATSLNRECACGYSARRDCPVHGTQSERDRKAQLWLLSQRARRALDETTIQCAVTTVILLAGIVLVIVWLSGEMR